MNTFRSALITGATGFVGSALVNRLQSMGIEVICLVRRGHLLQKQRGIETIEVDSFSPTELRTKLNGLSFDVVFNLAAYGVSQYQRDPELMVQGNVNLIAGLLTSISEWPIKRFIHTGSCSEYAEAERPNKISEDHPLAPTTLYGAAKAASTIYGSRLAAELSVPFTVLRLFGVYGPGEAQERLIPYIVRQLLKDEAAELTPGEQIRDLLHIDDVVNAFVAAAEYDNLRPHSIFNICSGVPVSVRQVGETVAELLDKPADLLRWGKRSYRRAEGMWIVGNNERFSGATGWRQLIHLRCGISQMIETLAERQEGAH